MLPRFPRRRFAFIAAVVFLGISLAGPHVRGDVHATGVPQLGSLPGAPYTLYLDFAGFDFTGTWGGQTNPPGNQPAFDNATGCFSPSEQAKISQVWASVAQAYTAFNINVTTVDPAVAAGQAGSDFQRQAYYDKTAKVMHTVVGPQAGNWYGNASGVSYTGMTQYSYDPSANNGGAGAGWHTNWIFADPSWPVVHTAQAAAHEDGHGLNLGHQSNYVGDTLQGDGYCRGDNNAANGTYAPIMGVAYSTQRGAWRLGDSYNGFPAHSQNDVAMLLGNAGLGSFRNDGIGHTQGGATALPLLGKAVNFNQAKGIITPASTANPTPIGASSYTSDYFSFTTTGTPVTLTVHDGTEFLSPGTADPGATLRSTLTILDSRGAAVGQAIEDASTLFETYCGTLAAGTYYAKISSYGGHTQTLTSGPSTCNTTYYYDMGSYFLTGAMTLMGDANGDGRVDVNDLGLVLTNYDMSGRNWSQGDFNSDGKVDVNDLGIVLTAYDKTSTSGLSAVPEPSSFGLLAAGAVGWLACIRRHGERT